MAKPVALAITTLTLPAMKVGVAGSITIAAKGGTTPYRFSGLALPPGYSVSGNVLSWNPTEADSFGFTIVVTDAKGKKDSQGYKVIVAAADPVVTPPPTPAPPPPPPNTEPAPATGLEWREKGPTRPIMSAWNWDIDCIKRLATLKLVNCVGYDRIDWCDGPGSRELVLSTLASYGLKGWSSPGLKFDLVSGAERWDYRSTAALDAADPRILFTALMDEPNQNGYTLDQQNAVIDLANADVIAAGGRPMVWECTHPLMAAFYAKQDLADGFRRWFDHVGGKIMLFGMDAYHNADGQQILMGRADYIFMNPAEGECTGTYNSFMINGHLHGPHVTGETVSQGRFAYAWLQACAINKTNGRALPSYSDMSRLFWGIYIPGGHGHGWFDTNVAPAREIGAFDPVLIPYAQELTRKLLWLNDDLGVIMDPVYGGRTPYTRRMGAAVKNGPSTGVGPETDTGVEEYLAPRPDQMPKLFEGVLLCDRFGNPKAYLIQSLSSNPNVLNDPVWGFTNVTFAPGQDMLFDYATKKRITAGYEIGFVPGAVPAPEPVPTTSTTLSTTLPGSTTPPATTDALHPDEVQAIKIGRGANYALMRTAGFKNDRTLLKPGPTQLPANVMLADVGMGYLVLFCQGPADFTGYDTRGFTIYWNKPFKVRMDSGYMGSDGWNMILPVYYDGPVSPLAILELGDVTFDLKVFHWGPNRGSVMSRFPTALNARSLRLTRVATSWANFGPGQVVRITDFYSEGTGQYCYYPMFDPVTGAAIPDVGQKDHPEIWHNHGADIEVVNFFLDERYPTHPQPPVPQWILDKMNPQHPSYTPGFKDPPERRLRHGMGTGWGLIQYRTDPWLDPITGVRMAAPFPPGRHVFKSGLVINHPDSNYYYNWQGMFAPDDPRGFPGTIRFEDTAQQMPYAVDGSGTHSLTGSGLPGFMDTHPALSGVRNVVFDTGLPMPGRINAGA